AEPADSQTITAPSLSVSDTIVLLNEVLMWAWPIAMFFLTRRRVRPRPAAFLSGATLRLRLLAASDRLLRALARARVRLRPLPVHRQAAAVADPAVRADLDEALDRLLPLPAQVALDLVVLVDVALELRDLLVGEVPDLGVGRQAERCADLARGRLADAVDVGQPDLEPLLVREVHTRDTCHAALLPLPLLVPRVRADDHGRAVPLDHAAPLTHRLHGRSDLHRFETAILPRFDDAPLGGPADGAHRRKRIEPRH